MSPGSNTFDMEMPGPKVQVVEGSRFRAAGQALARSGDRGWAVVPINALISSLSINFGLHFMYFCPLVKSPSIPMQKERGAKLHDNQVAPQITFC